MTHTLQVRFRKLDPSESLVALAADHYRRMQAVLRGPGECLVSVEACERAQRRLAYATVRVEEDGHARAEGAATHKNPRVALGLALADVHSQVIALSVAGATSARAAVGQGRKAPVDPEASGRFAEPGLGLRQHGSRGTPERHGSSSRGL